MVSICFNDIMTYINSTFWYWSCSPNCYVAASGKRCFCWPFLPERWKDSSTSREMDNETIHELPMFKSFESITYTIVCQIGSFFQHLNFKFASNQQFPYGSQKSWVVDKIDFRISGKQVTCWIKEFLSCQAAQLKVCNACVAAWLFPQWIVPSVQSVLLYSKFSSNTNYI